MTITARHTARRLRTAEDLRIINLALEDRARFYAGEPAGAAAEQVRAKIARNTRPR